jgi:hypothetical protein
MTNLDLILNFFCCKTIVSVEKQVCKRLESLAKDSIFSFSLENCQNTRISEVESESEDLTPHSVLLAVSSTRRPHVSRIRPLHPTHLRRGVGGHKGQPLDQQARQAHWRSAQQRRLQQPGRARQSGRGSRR